MRRFAFSPWLLVSALSVLGACAGPQQPFNYANKPTIRVARAALISGSPEIALNVASSILQTRPYDVPAQLVKGEALYALGLFTLSGSAYQEVLKIQPDNPEAHLGLGRIKLSDHDFPAAEAEFRTALRGQVLPETISNLGVSLDLQHRPIEAQAEYRRAMEIDPGSAPTRIDYARSLISTGDVAQARAIMQPVVASQPNGLLSPDVAAVQRSIEVALAGTDPGADAVQPVPVPRTRAPRAAE